MLEATPTVTSDSPNFQVLDNQVLSDFMEVWVFEPLRLTHPQEEAVEVLL